MTFRYPAAVVQTNAASLKYFTKNLSDPESGKKAFDEIVQTLGNSTDDFPGWHPILTCPMAVQKNRIDDSVFSEIIAYNGADHTRYFVRGFVTCPYSEEVANQIVESVCSVPGLHGTRLRYPLYADGAFPVMVEATEVVLEADGTIRSRDALAWCVQELVRRARDADVAETWWNLREELLGRPHGSRSSIFVNQHVGGHMRKILEAMNNSGMFGPIKESSLDMLSEKKKKTISETMLRAAINEYKNGQNRFDFELLGETLLADINDTWNNGEELSISVMIGQHELYTSGFYYPKKDILKPQDPRGKLAIAQKFL